MKKLMDSSGPIYSDIDFAWLMTKLYLDERQDKYKDQITKVIMAAYNLANNKIEPKDIERDIYAVVSALRNNFDYFKDINPNNITDQVIETLRSILSTLRHSQR
ncbi:hypothetical protein KK083_09720 [Fulvivirgaceae bacterium PWU4]|uniref:Uncharacterized protein n=1 Tax=Chryseosolibacter histidini TaxID=2782349 RepID=A0AAP2DLJ5_9BACT|nr:hypothetical protein [Chryseosolibacter histidini]MBT1697152.1 hypothetical protein [Chryseosolibacter histidini]